MSTIVASIPQTEMVGNAAQYFLKFRFGSAPVVDGEGKLVGVLSERDVMSIMLTPNWWTKSVTDVMKRNVVYYEEDSPVMMIYEFLSRVTLRGVVIVKHGRPTGMLSRSSLLRWFTNRISLDESPQNEDAESVLETGDSLHKATLIAEELSREATDLEQRLRDESSEMVPVVIGGVSVPVSLRERRAADSGCSIGTDNRPGLGGTAWNGRTGG